MLTDTIRVAALLLLVGLGGTAITSAQTVSTVPVRNLPALTVVGEGASSTIVRDPTGVSIVLYTKDLEPGAYTMWLLVWNKPEDCGTSNFCVPRPAGGPDSPESVLYGTNGVVGEDGIGYFGTRVNLGDTDRVTGGALREGLTNPMGAELHAVLSPHGPVNGEIADVQFFTPNGGCEGPCPDVQGAPHRAGNDALSMRLDALGKTLDLVARQVGVPRL